MRISLVGWADFKPAPEIPGPLDELIYRSTSRAIEDAGLSIDDIDAVCMASSDLNDGRAISTMTLTGSTGSYHRSELRVCTDALAAFTLGAAEIGASSATTMMICAWNKFSDVPDPSAISPLALEPVMHRALGYHPDAVLTLRQSYEAKAILRTSAPPLRPYDAAAAFVITTRADLPARAHIVGFGSSMGAYLRPEIPVLEPLRAAADAAARSAGVSFDEIDRVHVAGLHRITTESLSAALGVAEDRIVRPDPVDADLGYAAGAVAIAALLRDGQPGTCLVLSAGGIGLENAHALIVEVS
jgi:hypothetical protein